MGRGFFMRRFHASAAVAMAAVVFVLFSGCATPQATPHGIEPPRIITGDLKDGERLHAEEVVKKILERNSTVEADRGWISESYQHFRVKDLDDLEEKDYGNYAAYLDHGNVYIIVHPAYYTFFGDEIGQYKVADAVGSSNVMERFLRDTTSSASERLVKAQEKMLRDFIEYMSTERKLLILLLPYSYRTYKAYKYRDGKDEYMRYINEVTNESPSVLYFYSRYPNRGVISGDDRKKIIKFLYAIRANSVMLGGGFIGRCLDEFYKDLQRNYGESKLFMVPELSSISPADISDSSAADIMKPDGTINISKLTRMIEENRIGRQDASPKLRNLTGKDEE